jgi:FdhD protein
MDAMQEVLIIRSSGGQAEELTDQVAVETACILKVNGETLVTLLCTPSELEAMAVGFLLSEGLLQSRQSFLSVTLDKKNTAVDIGLKDLPADWQRLFHRKTITSGCGGGITFTDTGRRQAGPEGRGTMQVPASVVPELLQKFRHVSTLFMKTGGVHSAALADLEGNILFFSEDIGRHNAVDKLIGKAFLSDLRLDDKLLVSSGRISGEIMNKIVRSRIPMLVSRAAPTCMAIAGAEDHGVTLIGFARGQRMNVYTHPGRILFNV